ncbi:MAG: hydrogenase maturation nickel metallochaperone HypA [Selenomonadaceae bacterium]|nr:hydrogenase maturation nickel metallochaperone HypA [Selenomonadaceae bacterium]
MHEMALAEGILKIALDYAAENEASKINEVGLLIGEMSGVELEALEFSWRLIAQGTLAEGATLAIKKIPLRGRCSKCGQEMHIEHYNFWCPWCKDGVLTLISGREMQVEYLEVD